MIKRPNGAHRAFTTGLFWAAVAGLAALAAPQPGAAALFTLSMELGGAVNSQPVSATATGLGDSTTGTANVNWDIAAIPPGYSIWASGVSKASTLMANLAPEASGIPNLLTLAGGNFSLVSVIDFPNGGRLTSNVEVVTQGSQIFGTSVLSGTVDVPPLTGIAFTPAVLAPGPTANQFTESGQLLLQPADGSAPIVVNQIAIYTLPLPLPPELLEVRAVRDLNIFTLDAFPDESNPTFLSLQYSVGVRIIPEPSSLCVFLLGLLALALYLTPRRRCRMSAGF